MSTFGSLFRVTTYGESHCLSVGAIVDGIPPVSPTHRGNAAYSCFTGLATVRKRHPSAAQPAQTRPEQFDYTGVFSSGRAAAGLIYTALQRDEKDLVHLQSGIEHGVTLGTPISLLVRNEDQRPKDYSETDLYPRPSHADYTYLAKYGVKASSGGGRSSARETIGVASPPQGSLVRNH